jgi:hypothetical protein
MWISWRAKYCTVNGSVENEADSGRSRLHAHVDIAKQRHNCGSHDYRHVDSLSRFAQRYMRNHENSELSCDAEATSIALLAGTCITSSWSAWCF